MPSKSGPTPSSSRKRKQAVPAVAQDISESESSEAADAASEDESDVDAPRVVQWVDEDELDESEDENPAESEAGPSSLVTLQDDLSNLPMGALRKAQRALKQAQAVEDSDSEDAGSDAESAVEETPSHWGKQKLPEVNSASASAKKRANKHAPVEVTSKKPVTRRRTVVNAHIPQARDPRFLDLTGEFSVEKFRANYDFLEETHKNEYHLLKDNLKKAKKALSSTPLASRPEAEEEIERIIRALKKAESTVHRDKREKVEYEALAKVAKEEKQKQKEGKGSWFMKDAQKREVLSKARYDALNEGGGQRAVKKAIAKKQKKVEQKEKRSRPYTANSDGPRKRQRV